MQQLPKPTSAELEILAILWEQGATTVGVVHDEIEKRKPTGYTTVLKLLQIMLEKGLVDRDESGRAHIYRAAITQEQTQRGLLTDLIDRAFRGSAAKLVQQVLETKAASREELAEIKRMIKQAEAREDGK
jgi:predicted transcriptional regulator